MQTSGWNDTRTGDYLRFHAQGDTAEAWVEDVDYYLRHRLLNWFGCMARLDQNQLPQRFLWSKPKCPGQNRVTTTSTHQKSIKGETTRAVPAAVGGRSCAEGATAMVKRPKGPEAGMTATSGQSQTEERSRHTDGLLSFAGGQQGAT